MQVVNHPFLEGVKCREDGAIFVPAGRTGTARWTFGVYGKKGYRRVGIARKCLLVHRLICEAFHGACPSDKCQVDHLDRDPSNNRPENLRWVTPSENSRNRSVCLKGMEGVVSQYMDRAAYARAYYANNPEERERRRAYNRTRRAKKKEVLNNQP